MKKLFLMLVAMVAFATFSLSSCAGKDAKDSTSKSSKPTVESVKADLMKIVDEAKTPDEMKSKAEEYLLKLAKDNKELFQKVQDSKLLDDELNKYAEKKFPQLKEEAKEEVEEAADDMVEALPEAPEAPEELPQL